MHYKCELKVAMRADLQMRSCTLNAKRAQELLLWCQYFQDIEEHIFDLIFMGQVLTVIKRICTPVALRIHTSEQAPFGGHSWLARL